MEAIHHLIIGAGISGSYIGIQLLEQGHTDVLLLEAKGEFRGKQRSRRVYPANQDLPSFLELGSSVFHTKQDHLFGLLHYLGLQDSIRLLDSSAKAFFTYPGYTPEQSKKTFRQLQKRLYQHATRVISPNPSLETIQSLAKQLFSLDEFLLLQGCWPEWYEICDMNAYSVATSEQYMGYWCQLEGGLQQILDETALLLDSYIRWFQPVECIRRTDKGYQITLLGEESPRYLATHVYLCCNLSATDKMIFENLPTLQSYLHLGESRPTLRYYVILKRPVILPYESYSGPPVKGGWQCKYSLQVNEYVWLISYPDGPLAQQFLADADSEQLVSRWIEDMNHYFNVQLTRGDVDQIVEAYWKDAFSLLTPEWFRVPIRNPQPDGIFVTCLPQPFDQAWMNGHLYSLPGLLDEVETQFADLLLSRIQLDTQPIIRAVGVIPILKNDQDQISIALGKENAGMYEDQFNIFGGKVSDKAYPNVFHAVRAMFVECYEEAHVIIRPDIFMDHLLRVYLLPIFDTGTYSMIALLRVKDDSLVDWWDQVRARRLQYPYLDHKYKEMDEVQFFPVKEISGMDSVSIYAKQVGRDILRMESELDWKKSTGVPKEAFREVFFNKLGLPYVKG